MGGVETTGNGEPWHTKEEGVGMIRAFVQTGANNSAPIKHLLLYVFNLARTEHIKDTSHESHLSG